MISWYHFIDILSWCLPIDIVIWILLQLWPDPPHRYPDILSPISTSHWYLDINISLISWYQLCIDTFKVLIVSLHYQHWAVGTPLHWYPDILSPISWIRIPDINFSPISWYQLHIDILISTSHWYIDIKFSLISWYLFITSFGHTSSLVSWYLLSNILNQDSWYQPLIDILISTLHWYFDINFALISWYLNITSFGHTSSLVSWYLLSNILNQDFLISASHKYPDINLSLIFWYQLFIDILISTPHWYLGSWYLFITSFGSTLDSFSNLSCAALPPLHLH